MYRRQDQSPPSDVCLLLRAYAEQRWLSREVVPVLRQLESPDDLPEEQLGAALAYLEVIWIEALRHAAETKAAFAALDDEPTGMGEALPSTARRYHSAIVALRDAVARHVNRLLAGTSEYDDRVGSAALEPGLRPAIPFDLL
ncbi:MAG TPA: hypothetical protein VMG80_06110 [Solirubrobacteraceae bacterium]|nr:hypothetical protein [Solirubrobacteraceae bacterium]